jgi:hypothetical protein
VNHLNDFDNFNPKFRLDALTYVKNNLRRLIQLMGINIDDYQSLDEIESLLIDHFTRFPDEITKVNLKTFGVARNYIPRLNNIGGVVKYK